MYKEKNTIIYNQGIFAFHETIINESYNETISKALFTYAIKISDIEIATIGLGLVRILIFFSIYNRARMPKVGF